MPNFDDELLDAFTQEASEHLDTLENDLILLEKSSKDSSLINGLFRAIHSLKGSSGFFGLEKISTLAHTMENIMARIREGAMVSDEAIIDALLAGTDKLRAMINNMDASESMDTSVEHDKLNAILDRDAGNPSENAPHSATDDFTRPDYLKCLTLDRHMLKWAVDHKESVYVIRLHTHKDIKDKGKTPIDYLKEIESLGEFIDAQTDTTTITGLEDVLTADILVTFLFSTIMQPDLITGVFDVPNSQIQEVPLELILRYLESNHPERLPLEQIDKRKDTQSDVANTHPETGRKSSPSDAAAGEDNAGTEDQQKHPASESDDPDELPEQTSGEGTLNALESIVVSPSTLPATPEADNAESNPSASGYGSSRKRSDETIRVSVKLLDDLMNLAGEMVLGRNQLMRLSENTTTSFDELSNWSSERQQDREEIMRQIEKTALELSAMTNALQNISVVTTELQEKVMLTRLQPIGSLFGKFNRILRDLSAKLDNEIQLQTTGEDVELDKSIIEALSDPLTHLIRNCADHAIEPLEEREAVGKPRVGTVSLKARHIGGQVLIEIIDDGRGIDPEKMKRKAIEKNLISQREANSMSERQAQNLIFHPGFSTASQVSSISGRGVGMDVVKTNIENLGGSVEMASIPGRGTQISLRLPLTLAIIPAMIVASADNRFAIPQVNLVEIVEIGQQHKIEMVKNASVLRLRGKLLPLVDLSEVLTSGERKTDNLIRKVNEEGRPGSAAAVRYVLVMKLDKYQYGLIVDDVFDSEEIVVKPLSCYLKSAACYSGSTIMGDGKVAMILDTGNIAEIVQMKFSEQELQNETDRDASVRKDISETQSLLLFRNGGRELFAVNLSMIARIEQISPSQIDVVGDKEYLQYGEQSLRLLRLENYMSVSHPDSDGEELYVIVPKLVRTPLGIITHSVEDAIESSVKLDERSITGSGILGSAVINKALTLFLDIYGLFEMACPEEYEWLKSASRLKDKRILLAEDTAFFRTVIRKYLEEHSTQVDVATDGIEAWEMLNRKTYDLLLTDIQMPGMDGYELTGRVRSSDRLKDMPVVALTSLSDEHSIEKGRRAGFDAYQVKLDKEQLRVVLEKVLSRDDPRNSRSLAAQRVQPEDDAQLW